MQFGRPYKPTYVVRKSELKYLDTYYTAKTTSGFNGHDNWSELGGANSLFQIDQGDDNTHRDGREAFLHSLLFKGTINAPKEAGTGGVDILGEEDMWRIILVLDKFPNGNSITIADVLKQHTTTGS